MASASAQEKRQGDEHNLVGESGGEATDHDNGEGMDLD
jgi:hypothetical protein